MGISIAGVFGCMIFSTIITNAIRDSDYVTYGGEVKLHWRNSIFNYLHTSFNAFFCLFRKNKKLKYKLVNEKTA